ncbi:23S ribosomal RNA methyltransferase Erm [Cellulomonas sp. ES6]|uniref:23S ribosomal RNA methyltransferase Erm n=1 Tax=Cellulomonas sp. ES6 TaxID=3039384 RepID=UPI0019BDF8F1|nr:23S ribosomal RNA methyltransferase Erm [Cellulomonas sp. ES6]MBD3778294.1 23S ribosomal RNA methyltransferase Erm [Micrococcales bacterium]WHP18503.1 23S ribosomal RNA methyltransferase Erm [Cellulomonas sp. ES6]
MRHPHGGRHELGQNFLHHRPTVDAVVRLVGATDGPVLEIGAGDGALTRPLAALGRDVLAVELDPHRADRLRARVPGATVLCADALRVPLDRPVVVGNIPFHLTTPLLRRLLHHGRWRHAVLLTQWEVARKRAGVGGRTLLTAQTDPWFEVALRGRVPADAFRPRPSVDGGLLTVDRRDRPLVDPGERDGYQRFVGAVFTGAGRGLDQVLAGAARVPAPAARRALSDAGVPARALPRDLRPEQWAALWRALRSPAGAPRRGPRRPRRSGA